MRNTRRKRARRWTLIQMERPIDFDWLLRGTTICVGRYKGGWRVWGWLKGVETALSKGPYPSRAVAMKVAEYISQVPQPYLHRISPENKNTRENS